MPTKVVMEALAPTMEEGRVVEWKKQEGESVAVGDVLAEVETDKAVMELVARAGGTLLKQVVPAGATVPVSELVALIGEPGEAVGNGAGAQPRPGRAGGAAPQPEGPLEHPSTHPVPPLDRPFPLPPAPSLPPAVLASPAAGRVKASPLARRM